MYKRVEENNMPGNTRPAVVNLDGYRARFDSRQRAPCSLLGGLGSPLLERVKAWYTWGEKFM